MYDRPGPDWQDTEVGQTLATDLVAAARRNYRIGEAEAAAIVRDVLARQPALATAVATGQTAAQIERTRLFKDLASATRKNVYYQLRRYDRATPEATAALKRLASCPPGEPPSRDLCDALARGHVSTAERLPHLAEFHQELFAHIGTPAAVLDLGCGLYPLVFPFEAEAADVTSYVAADKDRRSLDILSSYASARGDRRLVVTHFDIGAGWTALAERTRCARYDAAFLFKLVPVLARQDRGAYQALLAVPADLVVMTGAVRSMTKNRRIERRERAVLLSFTRAAGLTVQAEYVTGEECVVVASRAQPVIP